jgi:hypothetical protein
MKLLNRNEFREQTLARDSGKCCVPGCSDIAVDAHHILNRNLFTEPYEFGGYFVENGAQLCSSHHYDAELTRISVNDLRDWCDIADPAIPSTLDSGKNYDCWGNELIEQGMRLPGPLFENEGCQKALKAANLLWTVQTW